MQRHSVLFVGLARATCFCTVGVNRRGKRWSVLTCSALVPTLWELVAPLTVAGLLVPVFCSTGPVNVWQQCGLSCKFLAMFCLDA